MDSTINAITLKRLNIICIVSFILINSVSGSCLSYGHSCWGAHGKRNGNHVNNNGIDPKSIQWFLSKLESSLLKPDDILPSDDSWKTNILRRNVGDDRSSNSIEEPIPGVIVPVAEPSLVKDLLSDAEHSYDMISNQKLNDEKSIIGPLSADGVWIDRTSKRQHSPRGSKINWQVLRNNGGPLTLTEDDIRNYI